jgi:hypothetical protein
MRTNENKFGLHISEEGFGHCQSDANGIKHLLLDYEAIKGRRNLLFLSGLPNFKETKPLSLKFQTSE